MNTVQRGNAAEAAVLHALIDAGIGVLTPFGDGMPFDLVAVLPNGELCRVQVKSGHVRRNCVEFNAASTDHGAGRLHYRDRADVIAVYERDLGRVFVVPVGDCPSFRGYLRMTPTANNQRTGVRMAEDYAFERWAAAQFAAAGTLEPQLAC